MARIGMRKPVYRKITLENTDGVEKETYGEKRIMGKAISADVSVQVSEAELYADDGLAESVKEFVKGTININTDDMEDDVEADLLGAKVDSDTKEVTNTKDDSAPWVQVGFTAARIKDNAKQYRGIVYTKVQFGIPNENTSTKGQTITFGTTTITGTLTANAAGIWRKKSKWMDTAEEAEAWVDQFMSA